MNSEFALICSVLVELEVLVFPVGVATEFVVVLGCAAGKFGTTTLELLAPHPAKSTVAVTIVMIIIVFEGMATHSFPSLSLLSNRRC